MKRDTVQMLVNGVFSLLALFASNQLPQYSSLIWIAFGALIATELVLELRKPVNYHSLLFSAQGFTFSRFEGMPEFVRWADIVDVHFFRSFDPMINQMETEWLIAQADGQHITVAVEFMHRRRFARELARHVPLFDLHAAEVALCSFGEGRWHCFIGVDSLRAKEATV